MKGFKNRDAIINEAIVTVAVNDSTNTDIIEGYTKFPR